MKNCSNYCARKIKFTALSAFVCLNITACGQIDLAKEALNGNGPENLSSTDSDNLTATDSESTHLTEVSLSEEASSVMSKVRGLLDGFREKRDQLCGIDSSERIEFKEQISAILSDETLNEDQKHEQIEILHEEFKPFREAEKQAIEECSETSQEQLIAIREMARPLVDACLGREHPKSTMKGRRGHKEQMGEDQDHEHEQRDPMNLKKPRQKEALNTDQIEAKLLSDECANAIDSAEKANSAGSESAE